MSRLLQRVSVIAGAPGIYLDFMVDWHTCECTVKVDISTSTNARESIADVPYGTNKRLTNPTANHDVPRWENYHHTWVDLPSSDNEWGLAVINNGQYGYDAKGSRLGLTLVRGPLYPTPSGEAWINTERKERHDKLGDRQPSHADMGTHLIQYVLLPHSGSWEDSKPFIPAFAHWINEGYVFKKVLGTEPSIPSITNEKLIWIEGTKAEISVIKTAEDSKGFVLRVVEVESQDNSISIQINPMLKITSIIETDLLERPLEGSSLKTRVDDGNIRVIELNLKPHEIKSLLLKL